MTPPTRPSGPPPDDFPEDDSNGRRPRRGPRSPDGPHPHGPQPTFTPHGVPSGPPSHYWRESPSGEQPYEGYSYPRADWPSAASPVEPVPPAPMHPYAKQPPM